jgi:hypothetical protein
MRGRSRESRRPLLILNNGSDGSILDLLQLLRRLQGSLLTDLLGRLSVDDYVAVWTREKYGIRWTETKQPKGRDNIVRRRAVKSSLGPSLTPLFIKPFPSVFVCFIHFFC